MVIELNHSDTETLGNDKNKYCLCNVCGCQFSSRCLRYNHRCCVK